jgi:hypothetical protein
MNLSSEYSYKYLYYKLSKQECSVIEPCLVGIEGVTLLIIAL